MVLNRNDKRKRKEGDLVDLMEPVSESPKRAKVHAQRKFAQGATTVFNVPHSPVKDKEKAKPAVITELITHKRPNTEDFLTFLCFRGTSLLPPDLNFFNIGTRKEKQEPGLSSAVLRKVASSSGNENHKPDLYQKTFNKVKGIITEKKKAQNEIQKNVSKLNTAACTVQALKKKYQEQRLAKQRMKKKFNSPCIMRTRSCTERTVLKRGGALSASQFLPMIERKRQTLRNRTVADKSKKIPSRSKHSLIKSRKKINLIKEKSSDVSNMDSINEEEDVHAEKSMSQGRRSVQKSVQKNVCTRSKTELRRITRSHSRRASSKNHSRRPTRRTKEAAAVYMEILGRKLISPDLDNDDNLSIESFPELPNARKIAQTESEFKAKVKQSALKSTGKGKDCKAAALSNISTKRLNKKKCNNIIFKSKRIIKIQRYCEAESDTESAKSLKASYTRPITRQSLVKYKKPVDRSLRSSKNVAKLDVQSTVNSKVKSQVQNSTKSGKEKYAMKRKRDQNVNKILSDKSTESARKDMKANEIENPPSDEETLGMILNKLRKKRNDNDAAAYNQTKDKSQSRTLLYGTKLEVSKISDDEESFHGFTKKAISTVLNSSQTRVNANLIATEESNENSYALKVRDAPRATSDVSRKCDASKDEARSPEKVLEEAENILNVSVADETQTPSSMKQSEKCNHKADVGLTNIVDMPLSTLHVRKERVNMSTEQIEKWLNDSSLAKEESKLEMEDMSGFRYDEDDEDDDDEDNDEEEDDENEDDDDDDDVDDDDNDDDDDEDDDDGDDGDDDDDGDDGDDDDDDVTTIVTEKMKTDASHLSISTKIQHLVRPVNVTLSKLTDKVNAKSYSGVREKNLSAFPSDPKSSNRKQQSTCRGTANGNNDVRQVVKENSGNKLCKSPFGGGSDVTFESDHNCVQPSASDNSTEKKSQIEKKSIFQGRKGFLAKVKERKVITPNANAFSAENESSVYAFETETEIPVSTPFRRKFRDYAKPKTAATAAAAAKEPEVSKIKEEQASKDSSKDSSKYKESTTSTNDIVDTANEKSVTGSTLKLNNFELQQNFANLSNVQILSLDKLTTSWTDVNHSTSIAVQVNLDDCTNEHDQTEREETSQYKSMEISTQTENSNEQTENDGQLFYIPLQTVTRNGPNLVQSQQVIQGVAVKLGTEGTNGTNQRVLLRAKLVTKPPMSIARCPPVGTVQPTTRTVQNNTTLVTDYSVPSTSSTANPIIAQPSAPSEFNSSSPIKDRDTTQTTNQQNVIPKLSNDLEKHTKVSRTTGKERKFSVDSAKTGKRAQAKSRQKSADQNSSTMGTTFSNAKITSNEACLVEAPTFYPTEKDFQDPLEYIDKIRPTVEKFGICRVVPPPNFKPECKVSDDMRFTAYNQYVHRMLHRWGLNVKEMMAIKKYLATQSITFTHPPWIGGMEVDLPHLYQTVQNLGGLKEVIEKKKWQKVADGMKIPKSAQDRVTKLDDIYCKYLLPYDTLSPEERNKLFNEVEIEWTKKETKALQMQDAASNDNEEEEEEDSSDEIEECIVKGRNMPLNAFYRIARNTQRMWFGENHRSGNEAEGASADEVETAFWKHVTERKRHVCVHAASIDSSGRGFGFSVAKNSPFARHPWNLKVLTNNAGSVLRALGPLMGVTVPTLHVGMLFTACCWYRDPHGLPWIEYLHTGAKKIWYGIPDEHNNNFREALLKMVPQYCKNKTIWLPSDTAMVPPDLLVSNGVSLCQTVQEPGQFIIVFPKAFTSSICTGYVVSESVYFAQPSWLETAEQVFKDIQDSCEPSIFSFEKLLFNIINDSRSNIDILKQILPSVIKIRKREIDCRKQLKHLGLNNKERLPLPDGKQKKGKKVKEEDGDFECEICRANLFVSLVNNSQDDSVYCLTHALQSLSKNKQLLRNCTLMYTYSEGELDDLIHKLKDKIETKSKKNNQMKQIK